MTVEQARRTMREAFLDDDFRRAYVDNISCILMDRIPELCKVKNIRDEIASVIVKVVFENE